MIAETWGRRAATEYITGALTAELLHTLSVVAVSPDSLERVLRVTADEFRHARMCRAIYEAAGGSDQGFPVDPSLMRASVGAGEADPRAALARCLGNLAINEALAVHLFAAMHAACSEPIVVEATQVFHRDDAFHAAVGWDLVDELLERMPDERAWAASLVPGFLRGLEDRYCGRDMTVTDRELAWGMLDGPTVDRVTRTALEGPMSNQLCKRGLLETPWSCRSVPPAH